MTSPRRTSASGMKARSSGEAREARANLFTRMLSPTRRVSSMEGLGMVNGWTRNVRTNSAKMMATSPACVYSKKNRLGFSEIVIILDYGTSRGRFPRGISLAAPALFDLEQGQEGLLGDVHPPDLLHPLLPFLLLLEELALARDVPAVALRQDVLAHRRDVLAGDDLAA